MHHAGGSDESIRRIALEIESGRSAGRLNVYRPHMQATQRADHIAVVKVHVYSPKLYEFRQFPQYDSGNRPSVLRQKRLFGRP